MHKLLIHGLTAILLTVSAVGLSACEDADEVEVEEADD